MKNKRVVVTGGVGFIGSNLAEGNEVVILDDLSTGRIDMKRHIPIARPITADEELKAIVESKGVTCIIKRSYL